MAEELPQKTNNTDNDSSEISVSITNEEYNKEVEKLNKWQTEAENQLEINKTIQKTLTDNFLKNPNIKNMELLAMHSSNINNLLNTGIRSTDSIVSAKSKRFNQAMKILEKDSKNEESEISPAVLQEIYKIASAQRASNFVVEDADYELIDNELDELDNELESLVLNDDSYSDDEEAALVESISNPNVNMDEVESIISENKQSNQKKPDSNTESNTESESEEPEW